MLFLFTILLLFSGFHCGFSGDSCDGFWEKKDVARMILKDPSNSGKCGVCLSLYMTDVAERLHAIYAQDDVNIVVLDIPSEQAVCDSTPASRQTFILKRRKIDRACLLKSHIGELESIMHRLEMVTFDYKFDMDGILNTLVNRINGDCNLFRDLNGTVNKRGVQRTEILNNLYTVDNDKCEEFDFKMLTPATFFRDFLSRSKPVIFRNFASEWPAMKKWTNLDFFSETLGSKSVHVKLSPSTSYEGVEPRRWWSQNFSIPSAVLAQLPYPDLVVVRPASADLTLRQLVGIIKSISSGKLLNASAYLEYTPMETIDPDLLNGVKLPDFLKDLQLESSNIWLSDGNTIGKLHQDGVDNILVQLVGVKNLTLFDPYHNENLYEAHIQEARLDVDFNVDKDGKSLGPWTFVRKRLMDSTSMVMSPVDLSEVNWELFPNFAKAKPIVCTIEAGDALFMPGWWWHEVESKPDDKLHFNLAVNFWYKSFFAKDIPCPECRLDIRNDYYSLLDMYY